MRDNPTTDTPTYVYTINDGEKWVSDPMTFGELSPGQRQLARLLATPGDVVKLMEQSRDITLERTT